MSDLLLQNQVFEIQNEEDFEKAALAVFRFQAENNLVYKQYLELLKIDSSTVKSSQEIPFLHISFFKKFKVVFG